MKKVKQPRKIQCNRGYNSTPSSRKDGVFCCSIYNSEIVQISLKAVLGGETGVDKETFFTIPFFEATIVEQFQVIFDDEGHDVMLQAHPKEDPAAYTTVSVVGSLNLFNRFLSAVNF